jgi:signal peptide peptidase SppA
MIYDFMLEHLLRSPCGMIEGHFEVFIKATLERAATLTEVPQAANETLNVAYSGRTASAPKASVTAVLPFQGIVTQKPSWWGGISTEVYSAAFAMALADETVKRIVLDVSSPGGFIFGVEELSTQIYEARGIKPILASVNSMACSAAYWVASAADRVMITPGGIAGSIGVFSTHTDYSKAYEAAGIKNTLISAGKYKVEGNPYEPLSEEALAARQADVNISYDNFVKAVARNRGVSVSEVKSGFGEGRALGAKEAVNAGLVDGIETFAETLVRQRVATSRNGKAAAVVFECDLELLKQL